MQKTDHSSRTIRDFGEQWLRYPDNEGYYASLELFADILSPFVTTDQIRGCTVAEIGSGTGRIVTLLLEAGANHVIAVEPSDAFEILCKNLRQSPKVSCLKMTGDQLPHDRPLDFVFSIGVLHHIPNTRPVVEAVFKALRPGGQFFAWLYGQEGNRFYLALLRPLRILTKRLPPPLLAALVELMYWPLVFYIRLCHLLPLPMRAYILRVFEKMSPQKRRLILYDQLNPCYAKYYTRSEAQELLADHGFQDVRVHHRHGYSWTVIGTKP
jgi:SAM-dependent methyltransferase